MSTTDTIREMMEAGTSTIQIIKDMYQFFNMSEEKTKTAIKQIISGIDGGCVPYKGESDLVYVEQVQATGPYFECAPNYTVGVHFVNEYTADQVSARVVQGTQPKRNFRKNLLDFWQEILNDGTENFASDVWFIGRKVVPESFMYQPFINLSNENTNRAC